MINKTRYFSVVKVDLTIPNLSINIFPTIDKKDKWYNPISVTKFAKETKSTISINTTHFAKKNKYLLKSKVKPTGIIVSNKEQIFPENKKYAALIINKIPNGYSAKIINSQENLFNKNHDYVIGGFWTILQNKEIIPFNKILDRRSAIGIDDSKTTLYFFIGNKFSYEDCAKILLQLGSTNAMEFDGGNSSELIVNGKSLQKKFYTRKVAAILGITIPTHN